MVTRTVVWDDEAKFSLKEIVQYIRKRASAPIAQKVKKAIIEKTKGFSILSNRFSEEDLANSQEAIIRSVSIWSYRIVYEVEAK